MPSPEDDVCHLVHECRQRVRDEIFKGGEVRGAHRSGTEWAAATILGYTVAAYVAYFTVPNVLTGELAFLLGPYGDLGTVLTSSWRGGGAGLLLGLGGAWVGLTVQHCGNHGAMSTKPWLNNFYGLCNDAVGASSLMWRYHHQVCAGSDATFICRVRRGTVWGD